MNRRILLPILAITVLATVACCVAKELTADQIKKSYQKINEYLEKNAKTDDPESDVVKLKEMLTQQQSKCTLLCSASLTRTLQMLVQLSSMPSSPNLCNGEDGRWLLEELDSGLADKSKSKKPNYPLGRVEKLISYYTLKNMRECSLGGKWPDSVEYAFKRHTYDVINGLLVDELPDEQDAGANLARVQSMLANMEPRDGALATGLRQLLELKRTLNADTCNQVGHQILLLNDLATRGNGHRWADEPLRRIDRIYKHYAKAHEQLCLPVFRAKFGHELRNLDEATYRTMLALAGSYYLRVSDFVKMMESINAKQVDEDFTVPEIVEFAQKELADSYKFASLDQPVTLDTKQIYYFARVVSMKDPDTRFLESTVDEKTGTRGVNGEKVELVLHKYLFMSCNSFLKYFDGLVSADDYDANQNNHHTKSTTDKFMGELTYHLVRAAHASCKYVTSNKEAIISAIKERVSRTKDEQTVRMQLS